MNDLLISNARIVDGTGASMGSGDVLVDDGRIVAVGGTGGLAHRTIDAEGCVVCPGFIDIHTHLDVQGFWDTTLSPSPLHGVTTAIGGNCGFTVAPLDGHSADYLRRMLARVEGMPIESLEAGVPWDWSTTEEFLAALDHKLAINTGFMVGHSAIRHLVLREESTERSASRAELEEMKKLLRASLAAGGLGFSSSWSASHSDHAGRPVPSCLAEDDELLELCSVVREYPGTSLEFLPAVHVVGPFDDRLERLMVGMSLAAGRPLNWNVLNVSAARADDAMEKLGPGSRAQAAGGKVVALAIPSHPPSLLSFESGFALDVIPELHEFFFEPKETRMAILSSKATREQFRATAESASKQRHLVDWKSRYIQEVFTPDNKRFEKRLVADIANELACDPFDAFVDILVADGLRTRFSNPPEPVTDEDWHAQARLWRDDRVAIGASDAGAHIDMLSAFSYPVTVLQRAVRCTGALSVEEAVHQMTAVPADLYGLAGRGRLEVGAIADLVIFDPESIAEGKVETKYDLPAGAGRLYAEPVGISHVIVDGTEVVQGGQFTEARPGRILRSGRDTVTPALG